MFPDGKVLSGSETGSLLLWEDAFVKCEFKRQGNKRCHKGMVEIIFQSGNEIITAARDGVIRIWDFTTIDTAEVEDTSIPVELAPKGKLRVAKGASIRAMHRLGSGYLVVDGKSGLWKIDLEHKTTQAVQKYHTGAVRAAAFSPKAPLFVTGGDDGWIRLWNIIDKTLVSEMHFEAAVTRIVWVGLDTDPEGITIYTGFADGCMRVLVCSGSGLLLKQPLRPHTSAVRDIAIATMASAVATTGDDGALFFFKTAPQLVRIGFVCVNGRRPHTKDKRSHRPRSPASHSWTTGSTRGASRFNGAARSCGCS
jgi:WD40 repeat protein